jgi:hypothetical protein
MLLRRVLPEHHKDDKSADAVLRAVGLVVTLTALVLGFFVNSAKTYYDGISDELKKIGAGLSVIDRTLLHYGPETADARTLLRQTAGSAVQMLWPNHAGTLPTLPEGRPMAGLEQLENAVRLLPAGDPLQQQYRDQALGYVGDIQREGVMMGEMSTTRLQPALMLVLLSWLLIIYLGFGLVWPRSGTAVAALVMSCLACTGAILMILELDSPLEGLVSISPAVLEAPLAASHGAETAAALR